MSRMYDNDKMTWGQYQNQPLKIIPPEYWRWCLQQAWFQEPAHDDLREYAVQRSYRVEDFDAAVREVMHPRRPKYRRQP